MTKKNNEFKVEVTLSGIGYKAECFTDSTGLHSLVLYLGYSHPINMKVPVDIKVMVGKEPKPSVGTGENQRLTLVGPCFNSLSNFAQQIKRYRKPDAYKAKGVIVQNKKDLIAIKIFRKEGKQKNL